jgi:hypothetical protein
MKPRYVVNERNSGEIDMRIFCYRFNFMFMFLILALMAAGCADSRDLVMPGVDDVPAADDDDDTGDDDVSDDDDDDTEDVGDCMDDPFSTNNSTVGLCWEEVFPSGDPVDEIRLIGYGGGGNHDWTYNNGYDVSFNANSGYLRADMAEYMDPSSGLFRVTLVSTNNWAYLDQACLDTEHFLCYYHETQGYSLCGYLEDGEIVEADDDDCAGTYGSASMVNPWTGEEIDPECPVEPNDF